MLRSVNGYVVYSLKAPSGKLYIGITGHGVKRRWRQHINKARKGGIAILFRAIRKYGPDSFIITVLQDGLTRELAMEAERSLIALHQTQNRRYGYNMSEGGDGDSIAAATAAAEMKADPVRRKAWLAKVSKGQADPAFKERHSTMLRARWADPAYREKMSVLHQSPEYREKLRARMADPEVKARQSTGVTIWMSDPAARARIGKTNRKHYSTKEGRAKCAERSRLAAARPETKEKQRASALRIGSDPIIKAARSRRRREVLANDPGIARRISAGRVAGIVARRKNR